MTGMIQACLYGLESLDVCEKQQQRLQVCVRVRAGVHVHVWD